MNPENKLWGNSNQSFESVMSEIGKYYQKTGEQNKPLFTQDGSEIHKELEGIQFNFWGIPGQEDGMIAVNFEGREDDKTLQLTGGVYNTFSEAKEDLREKAKELYDIDQSSENDSQKITNLAA